MAAAEWSAAIEHTRARAEHDIDLYFRVLTQYEGPAGLHSQSSRSGFYMTKQELLAFYEEYIRPAVEIRTHHPRRPRGRPAGRH